MRASLSKKKDKRKDPDIRFPGFEGEWEMKKLGDLSKLITKGTTPPSLGYSFEREGLNFIKVENIYSDYIDISSTPKICDKCNIALSRSIISKNDFLFSIAGTIGRTAIIKSKDLPANTNQALAIIRFKGTINTKLINYSLNLVSVKQYLKQMLSVGAQPNLNLQQVGDIKVNLPCLIEQNKITNLLSSLDSKINQTDKEISAVKEFKKGSLQGMFV